MDDLRLVSDKDLLELREVMNNTLATWQLDRLGYWFDHLPEVTSIVVKERV